MNLGNVGSVCANKECEMYEQEEGAHLISYGRSREGVQRYQCRHCLKVFNANKGTLFYRRKVSEEEIVSCLVLLAKGTSLSAIREAKGYKPETLLSWVKEAASHSEAITQVLMEEYEVGACQIDGLWSYVQHKGTKKRMKKRRNEEAAGARRF